MRYSDHEQRMMDQRSGEEMDRLAWRKALENKRHLDRLERALGNPNPIFAYTDGLPPPKNSG